MKKKKTINIKNFGGTPPGVRPVCPGDMSHLSRDMSRLSRGHSVPLVLIYTSIRPKCPRCPWDVPSLCLGRPRGIRPPNSFLWFFLIGFFLSILNSANFRLALANSCLKLANTPVLVSCSRLREWTPNNGKQIQLWVNKLQQQAKKLPTDNCK